VVTGSLQIGYKFRAVFRAPAFHTQRDYYIANREAADDPGMCHVDHVGTCFTHPGQQCGEFPRAVGHSHPQGQEPAARAQAMPDEVHQE
jgi:hypothetical protein